MKSKVKKVYQRPGEPENPVALRGEIHGFGSLTFESISFEPIRRVMRERLDLVALDSVTVITNSAIAQTNFDGNFNFESLCEVIQQVGKRKVGYLDAVTRRDRKWGDTPENKLAAKIRLQLAKKNFPPSKITAYLRALRLA